MSVMELAFMTNIKILKLQTLNTNVWAGKCLKEDYIKLLFTSLFSLIWALDISDTIHLLLDTHKIEIHKII